MTRHPWLPHPATTTLPPPPCPRGTRYTNPDHAHRALLHGLAHTGLTTTPCDLNCGGWHNTPTRQPAVTQPVDCEPHWRDNPDELNRLCDIGAREMQGGTAVQARDITTIQPAEEYL